MLQTVSLLCLKILLIFGQRVMAEAQNRPLEDACSTVINITVWFINFHYVYSFEIIVVCYFSVFFRYYGMAYILVFVVKKN